MNRLPTVLRIDGFEFYFFSSEGTEPPHIHVRGYGNQAKFWLNPVQLVYNRSYNTSTLNRIYHIVRDHQTVLLEAWNAHFAR